ncbi:shTK domain protein [Necator americanus]|uniref:ShTK domain protein n=1 Tax=Necator americanus TaxID=51031 RepID=W2T943_NECAM|nr:shTK domain protein [Necator americanus]ETN77721.1 shTK domain protein [Necator americanus]
MAQKNGEFFEVPKTCKDLAHDCRSRISLCDHPKYDGLMRRACAKTCNKCGTCYDATDRCQQWAARGFCNNYEYTHNLRMKLCAKTCKLC